MSDLTRRTCIASGLALAAGACTPPKPLPEHARQPAESLNAIAEARGLRFGTCLGTGNGLRKAEDLLMFFFRDGLGA